MRNRQGWSLTEEKDELLLRACKFTNYTTANRLIFYEALRKRFSRLRDLTIPNHVNTGEGLFELFRAYFDEARHITNDYETVFGLDPNDVGDRIPFYENVVVDSWRRLSQHVHRFDFSKLEYDVIGQIFETLIGPEERHKYGQYYTRPEVVDVISAFSAAALFARTLQNRCRYRKSHRALVCWSPCPNSHHRCPVGE